MALLAKIKILTFCWFTIFYLSKNAIAFKIKALINCDNKIKLQTACFWMGNKKIMQIDAFLHN
jgi:hypothetical protein